MTWSNTTALPLPTHRDATRLCASVQCALRVKPDAIITRNGEDFERSRIPVFDCAEFLDYLEQEKGSIYEEMVL